MPICITALQNDYFCGIELQAKQTSSFKCAQENPYLDTVPFRTLSLVFSQKVILKNNDLFWSRNFMYLADSLYELVSVTLQALAYSFTNGRISLWQWIFFNLFNDNIAFSWDTHIPIWITAAANAYPKNDPPYSPHIGSFLELPQT